MIPAKAALWYHQAAPRKSQRIAEERGRAGATGEPRGHRHRTGRLPAQHGGRAPCLRRAPERWRTRPRRLVNEQAAYGGRLNPTAGADD
jgi:hypothetical protein